MLRINLSLLLLSIFISVRAQQTFTIDARGAITPAITDTKFKSFKFVIDKNFKNKRFLIYLADGTTSANDANSELGRQFAKNANDDNYTISVLANRKILGCDGCLSVSDDFAVKLDGKLIGSFHLTPVANPDIETPLPSNALYYPGSAINDAMFIATNMKNKAKAGTIKKILETQYDISNLDGLNANQFLKKDLEYVFESEIEGALSLKGLASSVGGLDVTSLADGFAKFIVKRTKEELSIVFFSKFKDEIASNPDLKSAFPTTSAILNAIDEQIYNYSNYINNLREAFRSDLLVIDDNLPKIIDNHAIFFNRPENINLAVALRTGCYVTSSIKHKIHPGDILSSYPTNFFDDSVGVTRTEFNHLKGSIQSLQLFSESLKESDTTKHSYWVHINKVRGLVNDQSALQIYIGLVLQLAKKNYDKVKFSATADEDLYTKLNLSKNVTNFSKDYNYYKQYIMGVGSKVDELNTMIKEYEKSASDSIRLEQYTKYFKTTVQLLQSATKVSNLKFLSNIVGLANLEKSSEKYFNVAYEVADLSTAINRKRYPEVINHLVVVYNIIYAETAIARVSTNTMALSKKQKAALADKVITENATDPSKSISTIISQDVSVSAQIRDKDVEAGKAGHVLRMLAKYGAFMSNMIDAKNSKEVADAIESVALPVGSASIKRQTPFNVSLNAYCGLFVGNEVLKGVDENKVFNKFNSFGVTAPIGISISKGDRLLPWPLCFIPVGKGWSSSIFLSIVDLGAVAAYRFQDDKTEQVPTIRLKDIFSPGIFWSLGIPKTPISINFGTQIGPNLRKVTINSNDYSANLYTRHSVSVCVDIPLLNLYTKSKN